MAALNTPNSHTNHLKDLHQVKVDIIPLKEDIRREDIRKADMAVHRGMVVDINNNNQCTCNNRDLVVEEERKLDFLLGRTLCDFSTDVSSSLAACCACCAIEECLF